MDIDLGLTFIKVLSLSLLFSTFLSIYPIKLTGFRTPLILNSLINTSLAHFALIFASKTSTISDPSILFTSVLLSSAILTGSILLYIQKNQQDLSLALTFTVSSIVGMMTGFNLLALAFTITVITTIVAYTNKKIQTNLTTPKKHILTLELQQFSQLSYIQDLFNSFNIPIIDKTLSKQKKITLILKYEASVLIQSLLLKKIYSHKGIGAIAKL